MSKTDVDYIVEYAENEKLLRGAVRTLVNNKEVFTFEHDGDNIFFTNGNEEATEAVVKLNEFTQKTGSIIENAYESGFKNGMLVTIGLGVVAAGGYVYANRNKIMAKLKKNKINEYKNQEV